MARFICTQSCYLSGVMYRPGDIVEAASTPSSDYFASYTDEGLKDLGLGFQRDLDGTLYLPSLGWEDLTYPATTIDPPGAAADPARNTTDGLLEFSASAVNIIAGVAHMPHRRKMGSPIIPHVHWEPSTNGAGNVVLKFEYMVCPADSAIPAEYTAITKTVAAPEAVNHAVTTFGAIAVADTVLGTILKWKLSRLGNDVADTYAGTLRLMEFDIHVQQDSWGSGRELEK